MSYSANDDEYEINASTNKEIVTVKYPYTKLQFYGTNGYPELFEWEDLLFARTCSYASWWYIPSEDLLATYEADVPGGDPMNDLRYEYFVVEDFSLRYCQTDPAFRYPGYCQFYFDNLISGRPLRRCSSSRPRSRPVRETGRAPCRRSCRCARPASRPRHTPS